MRSNLAKFLYLRRYSKELGDANELASRFRTERAESIRAVQLAQFNSNWRKAVERHGFYADLARSNGLPRSFDSLEELDHFPIIDKSNLLDYFSERADEREFKNWMSTGGSSGTPFKFPVDIHNSRRALRNLTAGRLAAGIRPWDKLALVWGHSHLFGSGSQGQLKRIIRTFLDWGSNTDRISAYHLGEANSKQTLHRLCSGKYRAVIGYSSALRALLQTAQSLPDSTRASLPKTWIMTSEQYEEKDFSLVTSLGASHKLVVEYGSAEFGPIAYSSPNELSLSPFWWSFYTRIDESGELFIFDLDQTAFPFFNYPTGDLVRLNEEEAKLSWAKVVGRKNDNILLPRVNAPPQEIHSELLTHCIKCDDRVRAFQVRQKKKLLEIVVSLDDDQQMDDVKEKIYSNLKKEVSSVCKDSIIFSSKYSKQTTVAGKEQFIFRLE
jgi:phenylacetate-coenzyme A ligase PaaK-like adenylate-forming protein